jgi:poly(ribitol-phosphate) beta-N-acetylglucosaminyltransferase
MKVSAIVPVYDPGTDIDDCIRTLLDQSLPTGEFEVIFVDDGSTDGTGERLDTLAAAHENVQVAHIPNSGWPGRPRNVGLKRAKGEFVYFVDNDDWVGREALARLYERAVRDDADVVVGKVVGHGKHVPRDLFAADRKATLKWEPLLGLLTPHKLFRRSLLTENAIRFPEGRVRLEDHAFVMHAFFHARAISILATSPCYHWMLRDEGNASSGPLDPVAYYGHVREVLDLVEEHTEPGALREQLLSHWYRGKMLGRVGDRGFVARDPDARLAIYEEVRRLAAERYDWDVERHLAPNLRLRSRLLREGAFDGLVGLAEWESGIRARVALEELRLQGRGVFLRVRARLAATDGWLAFSRGDRTLTLIGPQPVGVDMADNDVELYLRSLADGTEYAIRTDARTRLMGARAGSGVTPEQTMVAWVSPGRGAAGGPLPAGDWEVLVRVSAAGFAANSRVRPEGSDEPLVLTVDERGWIAERGMRVTLRQRLGRRHPALARTVRRTRARAGVAG